MNAPRYSIQQTGDTTWELRSADGTVVGEPFEDRPGNTGYDQACSALGAVLAAARLAVEEDDGTEPSADGLLPERWTTDAGLCFSEDTAGGRDFSECAWSWRDPTTSLVPLMLQTVNDWGHQGAELAGFFEELHMTGTTPAASGRFYDNEAGAQFRDLLLDGRRYGISVDPTENVEAEYREECMAVDEDGYCTEWDFSVVFTAYEIGGATGCPFPCFENASVVLDTSAGGAATIRASALSIPARPPRAWLTIPEPVEGADFIDGLIGDEVLVPQRNRAGEVETMAVPLTIRDDGLVYGHLTTWGQCHVADPWGAGVCASAPASGNEYADFMVGLTTCDDGTQLATGTLTVGCEHSYAFDCAGVRDHLAHAGMGWASVRIVDGVYGPWVCGSLKPGVTQAQVDVLRSLALSGEWVGELAGILAVNVPGLPVQRSLAASAFAGRAIGVGALRASARPGGVTSLVGPNIVRPCPECAKNRLRANPLLASSVTVEQWAATMDMLHVLERRTRPLITQAAEASRARLSA